MLKRTLFGLFAVSVILNGCGGGGGSSSAYSGPTAAIAVTTTTEADTVASYAKSAVLSSSLSSMASDFTPLTNNTNPEFSASPAVLGNFTKHFADLALKSTASGASLVAGVTQSQTYDCGTSGTMTLTVSVADPYATSPSPGDSFTFALNNCVNGSLMETGSVTFAVNSYTTSTDFSATYTFSNYKMTILTSGDYLKTVGAYTAAISVTASDTTYSITGNSLVFEASLSGTIDQLRYSDFSFVDILYVNGDLSFDHDFTIASTEIGGSITVNTVTPFYIISTDTYPYQGELVVTAADNVKVKFTVIDNTSVTIYYDLDGDGTYENDSGLLAWGSV